MTATRKDEYHRMFMPIQMFDDATSLHCARTESIAFRIGKQMGLSDLELDDLCTAALLHDYGKIFIPKGILNAKRRLSAIEMQIMKSHVWIGVQQLQKQSVEDRILAIIAEHHERLDGSGYPLGTRNISKSGRILAVADVYDAMTSSRCYKEAYSKDVTLKKLEEEVGRLDEEVIQIAKGITTSECNDCTQFFIF